MVQVAKMAAALGAWTIVVATYVVSRCGMRICGSVDSFAHRLLALVGRASLMVALVLYSPASKTAFSLLNCATVAMAPAGILGLNGGVEAVAASGSAANVQQTVSVLVQVRGEKVSFRTIPSASSGAMCLSFAFVIAGLIWCRLFCVLDISWVAPPCRRAWSCYHRTLRCITPCLNFRVGVGGPWRARQCRGCWCWCWCCCCHRRQRCCA